MTRRLPLWSHGMFLAGLGVLIASITFSASSCNSSSSSAVPQSSGSWAKLGEVTLTADSPTVDFTSIPSGYRFLRVVGSCRYSGSLANTALRFNDDMGANYEFHRISGVSTTVSAASRLSLAELWIYPLTLTVDQDLMIDALISNAPAWNKLVDVRSGDGTQQVSLSAIWRNTTAEISKISLWDNANGFSFRSGTTFVLYGAH